ncbi:MAG: hypothetical protein HRU09_20080 [Oligoflexales bacterium]|nr:hypothetical protein [Oligoflexales bacterium]
MLVELSGVVKNYFYVFCLLGLVTAFAQTANASWTSDRVKPVRCKEKSNFRGKVCVVENVRKGVGTIVSVYDRKHHWVASGHIVKKYGKDALIFFRGKKLPKFKLFYLENAESTKWKHSYFDAHKW